LDDLIGVILLALALGAWLGGAAADRKPVIDLAGALLAAAGLWSAVLAALGRSILSALAGMDLHLLVKIPILSLVLFAIPSLLLGAVPPVLLRCRIADVKETGRVAGVYGALGTAGSLVGTYVAGYVLLPFLSIRAIYLGLAALLGVSAAILIGQRRAAAVAAVLTAAVVLGARAAPESPFDTGIIYPSACAHVRVTDRFDDRWTLKSRTSSPTRALFLDAAIHSAARVGDLGRSNKTYCVGIYALVAGLDRPFRHILVSGGGGMHVPRELAATHRHAWVDVIEIDPAVVAAATEQFGAVGSRVRIEVGDARPVMAVRSTRYDLIIADAYASSGVGVPWYLLTEEAIRDHARLLDEEGVLVANLFLATDPSTDAARRYQANLLATFRTSFRWVILLNLAITAKAPGLPANALLVAGNGSEPDRMRLLDAVVGALGEGPFLMADVEGGTAWTDDAGFADYEAFFMWGAASGGGRR
jgi:spermidine synthase